MGQIVNRRTIVAVAFTAALALTGTSEAASLFKTPATGAPVAQQSLWSDAWTWMTTVWTNLLGVSTEKSATTTTTTTTSSTDPAQTGTTTTSCVSSTGCTPTDAGWGIDPNG